MRPFTAKQIALLRTFADQAAIALENERLREALEARNRELTEGLERETATGEILRIISRSLTDVQPVLEAIVESATRLCDASIGSMARFDGHLLTLPVLSNASTGEREAASRVFPTAPTAGIAAGRAILERRIIHIHDVRQDSEYTATPVQQPTLGYRTVLAVPLLREGEPIGALVMWRRDVRPFSQKQIDLMTTFADQAVIAIENVRLFTELEAKNRDLTEALDQQTATSEILRVISSSPTDVQPVFDTIAGSAMRLCDAAYSVVGRFDGELLHLVAHAHVRAEGVEALRQYFPMRPSRATTTSRAILDRAVVHVPDVLADPDYSTPVARGAPEPEHPGGADAARRRANRDDLRRTARARAVLRKADRAPENLRRPGRHRHRERPPLQGAGGDATSDLTEALEQQTATSEILRVISSSPTDVQPVFDTIVASAVRLCSARMGAVYRFDGKLMHLVAHHNYLPEVLEMLRQMHPRPPAAGSGLRSGRPHSSRRTDRGHAR